MHTHTLTFISGIVVGTVLVGFASAAFAAWTEPTASPPGNNTPAPLNTGAVKQQRAGGLHIMNLLEANSLTIYGNGLLSGGNRYLNFGTTAGDGGYGFRDNNGTMQFKNSGGSWTNIGSGGTSSGGQIAIPNCASGQVLTASNGVLSCISVAVATGGGDEGSWCGLATMGRYPKYYDRYYSAPQNDPRNYTSIISCKGTPVVPSCPSGYTAHTICDAYAMDYETAQPSNTSCLRTCIKGTDTRPGSGIVDWLNQLEKNPSTPPPTDWMQQLQQLQGLEN